MNPRTCLLALALAAAEPIAPGQTTFTKITAGPLVTDLGIFTPSVWADFDNDGWLDLFVPNWSLVYPNVLYRNNGGGSFSKIAQGDPVRDRDMHMSAAAGDYDNDGYVDLFVATGFGTSPSHNTLYHNNGDGTFKPVSAGGVDDSGFFWACAWADYDNDGFLDLLVAKADAQRNQLWHNNGNGSFTRITAGPVASDNSVASAALWADYDNDGFQDLVILNNGIGHNYLYHNQRDGTFSRVLTNVVALDKWIAQSGAWADYDNDGFQDLFATDYAGKRNRLYHNNGDGTFTSIDSGPMLLPTPGSSPFGCAWGDYDNDGYLDLIVCSDNGTNALFHNNGDGTFTQILSGNPVNDGGPGIRCNGPCWVDYDNDGFLDLFITKGTDADNTWVSNLLYHNDGNTNAWLEVKCVGTASNRSAIGAKVRVQATIGGKTMWQMREIHSGTGWGSEPLVAHFGLRDATNVDTVRIEWPSGTVQELHNLVPRQILTITEPPRLRPQLTNGVPGFWLKGGRFLQYQIEASVDLTSWNFLETVTPTNFSGTILISDDTPAPDYRFYRAVQQ
jgi:hypothetical protein